MRLLHNIVLKHRAIIAFSFTISNLRPRESDSRQINVLLNSNKS